jgi:hypothetical protein
MWRVRYVRPGGKEVCPSGMKEQCETFSRAKKTRKREDYRGKDPKLFSRMYHMKITLSMNRSD